MYGLNGIFAYHPAAAAPDQAELIATRDAMRARGPDGCGTWRSAEGRCALAHRRLSILDLSDRAAQPMLSEDGDLPTLNRALALRIRAGAMDLSTPGLADHLWATTLAKLAVDQPNYSGYRAALAERA